MKKVFLSLAIGAMGISSTIAQTNFRNLDFKEAVKQAQTEQKLLFIDFYTDWCGPCRKMAKEVFPQKEVGNFFNSQFICIKLNAEKEGKELANRFNVKAYPTFLILDSKEQVKATVTGSLPAEDFIAKIKNELNPDLTPERMKIRYEQGERSPELINAYAMFFMQSGREEEGFNIVNNYFNSLNDKQKLSENNFFLFSRYTQSITDPKFEYLLTHVQNFDKSIQNEAIQKIQKLYHTELLSYLSGYYFETKQYNKDNYEKVKKSIQALKLDQRYPFKPIFNLIECYALGDMKAHFELIKTEKAELNERDFELILLNLTRLYHNSPEIMPEVIEYIRTTLPTLKASTIMMMGRLLMQLEKQE